MASDKSNKNFTADIVGGELLDSAIEWISKNMEPEDVFNTSKLKAWAFAEGYVIDEGDE